MLERIQQTLAGSRLKPFLKAVRDKLEPKELPPEVAREPADDLSALLRPIMEDERYEEKRLPYADAEVLYKLVRAYRPSRTLEIGYYSGMSTIAITAALRALGREPGSHLALDLEDWNGAPENVRDAGLDDLVRFVTGDSALTLPRLVDEDLEIDFAFIDGNHRFDFCLVDFFYTDRMLSAGGVVAIHDYAFDWRGVKKMVHFVERNRAYERIGRFRSMRILRKLRHDFSDGEFDRDARLHVEF